MDIEDASEAFEQEIVEAKKINSFSLEDRIRGKKEETHDPLTREFQHWLREVRKASRDFYIAATPDAYRIIDLTQSSRMDRLDIMDNLAGGRNR